MRPFDHPSQLSPEQRCRELAGILAAGLLRLRKRRPPADAKREPSAESAGERLEVSGGTVLSVHTG